jgi:hypothetical protein
MDLIMSNETMKVVSLLIGKEEHPGITMDHWSIVVDLDGETRVVCPEWDESIVRRVAPRTAKQQTAKVAVVQDQGGNFLVLEWSKRDQTTQWHLAMAFRHPEVHGFLLDKGVIRL